LGFSEGRLGGLGAYVDRHGVGYRDCDLVRGSVHLGFNLATHADRFTIERRTNPSKQVSRTSASELRGWSRRSAITGASTDPGLRFGQAAHSIRPPAQATRAVRSTVRLTQ